MKHVRKAGETDFSSEIFFGIMTFKVVCIVENCDKRQKVYGKIRSIGVAENVSAL